MELSSSSKDTSNSHCYKYMLNGDLATSLHKVSDVSKELNYKNLQVYVSNENCKVSGLSKEN